MGCVVLVLLVLLVLSQVNCINFRSSQQFEEFNTITMVMKKYLMITRCKSDRTPSDLFAVYPFRDGSHECAGDNILSDDMITFCVVLPGCQKIEDEVYQIFANVQNTETCYHDGDRVVSSTGKVNFDWFKANSDGFNRNGTVKKFSYEYHNKCEDIPEGEEN